MNKKKIAIINQRYGLEVNGGSEDFTRYLSEQLPASSSDYEVTVLTTCARDYNTWENYYPEGENCINGVKIVRFSVDSPRNSKKFKLYDRVRKYFPFMTYQMEQKWIDEQGPFCPSLINYIKEHANEYDVFVFVTYLYYLTVMGLKHVAEKSILIPTAHDEPFLKMRHYRELFQNARAFFFLTEEEMQLVYDKFQVSQKPSKLGGMGIEVPQKVDSEGFKKKNNVDEYIVYVGRIDFGKNCHQLFDYYDRYQKKHDNRLKLVMMGKEMMEVPDREDIISLGFVSDKEKYAGMAGAKYLILPSINESFSIVVLESMKLGVPVIVNGNCEVLKGHCIKSNGGICYQNYEEFEQAIDFFEHNLEKRLEMGRDGKQYVEENYQWDAILKKFCDLIEVVAGE